MTNILEEFKKFILQELTLFTKLGQEDPKSYEIWYHRFWLIKKISETEKLMNSNELTEKIISKDLSVCS